MHQAEIAVTEDPTESRREGPLGCAVALLLLPATVLAGIYFASTFFRSFYIIPLWGVILGIGGGIFAGLMPLFHWRFSKRSAVIAVVILVSVLVYGFKDLGGLVVLALPPGLVNSLIIFGITRVISIVIQRKPGNRWLIVVLLVIGVPLAFLSSAILAFLGMGLMSQ